MKAELITETARLGSIEAEWRAFAELRGNGFVSPEWFRAWLEHQANGSSPLVGAVRREDGRLAGVMPLVLDASRRPRAVRFAGARLGDRFHPAAAEEDEAAVAAATMAELAAAGLDRHLVLLEHVDADRDWWREMQREPSGRRAAAVQQQSEMLHARLRGVDWDAYLAGRSRKLRKQIRRGERQLERDHGMEVRATTAATVAADMAELFRLHDLRFATSSLAADGARQALTAFAVAAEERGWLRLYLMDAEGKTVAAVLAWRLGDSYVTYQGGFDPAWSNRSVGTVLEAMTIRSAIAEGAAEYDFLLGTEDYKRRFTDASRSVQTVVITPALRPIRLLASGEARARRLGRRISAHPRLGPKARSLRRLLPSSRG
jgi:CelD/BcsL family acetyltransferase involved in cellulose biosynthesis